MKNGKMIWPSQYLDSGRTARETYPKTVPLGAVVEEDEGEAKDERTPEDEQAEDEVSKAAHWCEVAERLGAKEPGECVLFELSENVRLLQVKEVRDERRGSLRRDREGVQAERRTERASADRRVTRPEATLTGGRFPFRRRGGGTGGRSSLHCRQAHLSRSRDHAR